MSYNLATNLPDEITISGQLGGSRKWANVYHGRLREPNTTSPTSAQLMTAISALYAANIVPLQSSTVTTTLIRTRQITALLPAKGRFFRVTITVVGGVVVGLTILDPGVGYVSGTRAIVITSNTGTGCVIQGTFTGGGLTTITVLAGGVGYLATDGVDAVLPDAPAFTPNRFVWQYSAEDQQTQALTGGITSDFLPNFNAFSIKIRSGAPGRYGRLSAHLPGVAESQTTGNSLTGPTITAMNAAVDEMYTPAYVLNVTDNYDPSGVSKLYQARFGTPNLFNTAFPFVAANTLATTNTLVGTMRRRKLKA